MPDCTIILKPDSDEFGDSTIDIRVKPEVLEIPASQTSVTWQILNRTNADETVKLRAFRNKRSMSGPHNPYFVRTPKLKVTVPNGSSATITLDIDPAKASVGDTFKYNIHIGKVVAVDPELEII